MITITNLAMQYGARLLFTDVNLSLNAGYRYGLVGANGAGKTTFFKVVMGDEVASFGAVGTTKYARIGCLKQDHFLYENTSIINSVIAGKSELWSAIQEKEQLLALDVFDDEAGYRLGELEQIIADNDGYIADIFAAELLIGLGIGIEYHNQPLSVLSGGYKLRVLLAQSLFNNPDILLLDEPTNHLDIMSIYWLENYLKEKFKGVVVFISHDMMFLNNIATHILDIDYGEIRNYTGNYDKFLEQKQQIIELKLSETKNLEKKISQMQAFVDKFRASASRSSQALSREKQIEKIELPDIQKSSRVYPYFNFKQKRPSGKTILSVAQLSKSYGAKRILHNVNFSLQRSDKLVIIGPNGIGKSTLLKILLRLISGDGGSYEWSEGTQISYFAQDHHDLLNESITVMNWLSREAYSETENKIRSTLGQVLFRQDEVNKNILNLSGGEGARLLLAKIILEESNVLIMDEPTNHLDIEAKDSLKKALINYPGTLILVTHDRDFAKSIATRILAITSRGVTDFKGTYEEYLHKYENDYLSSNWVLGENKK
jgi:ATPase subunit of ABC transporter with duplicated ATPase domains